MRIVLCFAFLFFLSVSVFAQNWRTVNPNDTVYFRATLPDPCPICGNTVYGTLRMIFVDSVRTNNGDSLYYFYKTARSGRYIPNNNGCADTAAASWMGSYCVRRTSGVEYYFNLFSDTISINTEAAIGDTWIMGKDTSGNIFHATVITVDTATIDGVLDSVKTINLQALNGANIVATFYDTIPVRWSKNHGWINPLDWFDFPYTTLDNQWMGMFLPNSYERLQAAFKAKDYKQVDLSWKYAPGNEWTYVSHTSSYLGNSSDISYHDSVVSSSLINQYKIFVTIKRSSLDTPAYIYSTTITVDSLPYNPVRNFVYPEYKQWNIADIYQGVFSGSKDQHYKILPFCDDRDILYYTNSSFMGGILSGSCWQIGASISGFSTFEYSYLEGFGQKAYRYSVYYPNSWDSWEYTYIKIGNCTIGSYTPVGINEVYRSEYSISVVPNPATNNVNINVSEKSVQLAVYDMMGRVVRNENLSNGSNILSIEELPAGLYLLRFSGPNTNYTYKLIKN